MTPRLVFGLLLGLQLACAGFFIGDILANIFGLRSTPLSWRLYELIEISAALGLVVGVAVTATMLARSLRQTAAAQASLRVAQGAFHDVISDRFAEWELTPAERDVAFFAIKGMSTADIARLRDTSEGTVKAQTNAIYRKAGVTGRPQLLSLFIDDLLDDALSPPQVSQNPPLPATAQSLSQSKAP